MIDVQDPQQELFTILKTRIEQATGLKVYDGVLPPDGTPYPFVYLGDTTSLDEFDYKDTINGQISQTIHVWHGNPNKRGTMSNILLAIKKVCYELGVSNHYSYLLKSISLRILPDNSTKVPLTHGVIESAFAYYWRKPKKL